MSLLVPYKTHNTVYRVQTFFKQLPKPLARFLVSKMVYIERARQRARRREPNSTSVTGLLPRADDESAFDDTLRAYPPPHHQTMTRLTLAIPIPLNCGKYQSPPPEEGRNQLSDCLSTRGDNWGSPPASPPGGSSEVAKQE